MVASVVGRVRGDLRFERLHLRLLLLHERMDLSVLGQQPGKLGQCLIQSLRFHSRHWRGTPWGGKCAAQSGSIGLQSAQLCS